MPAVLIRCGPQIAFAEVFVEPNMVMVGSGNPLRSGVVIGRFQMQGVDAAFVREVIAYAINEGSVFEETIAHESGDDFASTDVHWCILGVEELHLKLGW